MRIWLKRLLGAIVIVVVYFAISFITLGSVLFPFLLLVVPLWFFFIFRYQVRNWSGKTRTGLASLNWITNWIVIAVAIGFIAHAYANRFSVDRLIPFVKRSYIPDISTIAQSLLVDKGVESLPVLMDEVQSVDWDNNLDVMHTQNLFPVIAKIGDKSTADHLTKLLDRIPYPHETIGRSGKPHEVIMIGSFMKELSSALVVLICDDALEPVIKKLGKIEEEARYRIVDDFAEAVIPLGNDAVISVYMAGGAPDLGEDSESYKQWYRESRRSRKKEKQVEQGK